MLATLGRNPAARLLLAGRPLRTCRRLDGPHCDAFHLAGKHLPAA